MQVLCGTAVASEMISQFLSASQTCCSPQRLTVQVLCEQRHFVLLPQGFRGLPAEADGSLCGISLQGKLLDLNLLLSCFCFHLLIFLSALVFQNSPNDLQLLSDAPAHHLFCLLPPVPPSQNSLPEVLAVVQVRATASKSPMNRQCLQNSLLTKHVPHRLSMQQPCYYKFLKVLSP